MTHDLISLKENNRKHLDEENFASHIFVDLQKSF